MAIVLFAAVAHAESNTQTSTFHYQAKFESSTGGLESQCGIANGSLLTGKYFSSLSDAVIYLHSQCGDTPANYPTYLAQSVDCEDAYGGSNPYEPGECTYNVYIQSAGVFHPQALILLIDLTYNEPTFECWDGSFAIDEASCPASYNCWDGSIAADLASCPAFTCWDGSTSQTGLSGCSSYVTCWDGNPASDYPNCSLYMCWDHSQNHTGAADCPASVTCPYTGHQAATIEDCPTIQELIDQQCSSYSSPAARVMCPTWGELVQSSDILIVLGLISLIPLCYMAVRVIRRALGQIK
jgi:hypothetical protein